MAIRSNPYNKTSEFFFFYLSSTLNNKFKYFSISGVSRLTSNKQLNPSGLFYLRLKGVALCLEVSCISIKNVSVLCSYVDVLEEVVPHEGVIALRVISGKSYDMGLRQFAQRNHCREFLKAEMNKRTGLTDILVHVEGFHKLKGDFSIFVVFNQLLVTS